MEGACLPAYGPGGGAPRAWRPSTHACMCACLCTQVVEEEGVAALFKGAAERVMRSSPQFGAACVCGVHATCACAAPACACPGARAAMRCFRSNRCHAVRFQRAKRRVHRARLAVAQIELPRYCPTPGARPGAGRRSAGVRERDLARYPRNL